MNGGGKQQGLFQRVMRVAGSVLGSSGDRADADAGSASEMSVRASAALDCLSASDLAAAIADPLIIFDRQGAVVEANGAAQAAFGPLSAGTPLRLRFRTPEMQQFFDRYLQAPAAGAQAEHLERSPVERLYRVTASPLGEERSLNLLMFRDQSEARRIDRMRADFVANASHELRTPLASIAGFIETLRGPARNDAAARDKFLQIMQDQTARMARLIDDLLSLSRLEMNASIDPNARVDVAMVVRSVVDSLRPLAAEYGVSVDCEVRTEKTSSVGNHDELFQVFENLLENACKYGQSGGRVVVLVEAGSSGRGREVLVTVQDFGPGIAEEHIPRVTERFYRVDVETSRAQKGTGLGLSIVKHILTRHNAYLTIKSEIGKGAAFTVHLPAT
jgi:two-component system phosphate regulon sensor histidine kinase PhoR